MGRKRESIPRPTATTAPVAIYPSHQLSGQCQLIACQNGRRLRLVTTTYIAASMTRYARVMAGTITSGPGFLLSSAAETPWPGELCKATKKAIELKRKRDTSRP